MKKRVLFLACLMAVMAVACGKQDDQEDIIGGADEPTTIVLDASDTEDTQQQEEENQREGFHPLPALPAHHCVSHFT